MGPKLASIVQNSRASTVEGDLSVLKSMEMDLDILLVSVVEG